MTGRAAALQGGLAAAGLIAAHLTWQREPERAPGDVSIIEVGKSDIGRVHYEDDSSALDVETRKGGPAPGIWLHLVAKTPPKATPKNVSPKAAPPPPTPPPAPPRDMRGGEEAQKLLDQLASLRSPRAFGVLDAGKLKELGLDVPKKKLTVTVKGELHEFAIGQPPGGSAGESYLRDVRDGRVYLMPHGMVTELQGASTRLVDRKIHDFDPTDFDKIVLSAGGKKRELVQTHRENVHTTQIASPKTPDKPDQMAHNWHDTLWRTVPMEFLGAGEIPKDGTPEVVARVEYFDGAKPLGWLEIGKAPTPVVQESSSESSAPASAPPAIFFRSEHTSGWVRTRATAQLAADAEKVAASP